MKNTMTLVLLCSALVSMNALAATSWNGRVFRGSDLSEISKPQMIQELSAATHVVMGEKHYTPAVQNTEAEIITSVMQIHGANQPFTTAWEFLNASEKDMVQGLFAKFTAGEITAKDFLDLTQGASEENLAYAPVLEATKALAGHLLATNLTRKEKAPVVKYGIGAVDPALLPPGFAMGSDGYHARFLEFMKEAGHATPEQAENYYAAQCLTDDVIAWNVLNSSSYAPKFLVVGSFHTDFFDGTVARMRIRAPQLQTSLVRIIDASDYEEKDLMAQVNDPVYGPVADYVVFVNEPGPQPGAFFMNKISRLNDIIEGL